MIVEEEEMMMMKKKKSDDDEEEEQGEQIIITVGMCCWEKYHTQRPPRPVQAYRKIRRTHHALLRPL